VYNIKIGNYTGSKPVTSISVVDELRRENEQLKNELTQLEIETQLGQVLRHILPKLILGILGE